MRDNDKEVEYPNVHAGAVWRDPSGDAIFFNTNLSGNVYRLSGLSSHHLVLTKMSTVPISTITDGATCPA